MPIFCSPTVRKVPFRAPRTIRKITFGSFLVRDNFVSGFNPLSPYVDLHLERMEGRVVFGLNRLVRSSCRSRTPSLLSLCNWIANHVQSCIVTSASFPSQALVATTCKVLARFHLPSSELRPKSVRRTLKDSASLCFVFVLCHGVQCVTLIWV